MRTLRMWCMPKCNELKEPKAEASFLQRSLSFLFRDLMPSLIMLIIISLCASFVAEKIYQAKASRSHTISMVKGDSHQKSPSLQGDLKPEGDEPN